MRRWVLLVAIALGTSPVDAARLPDWAEAIAESKPALPAEVGDHGSRVLWQETRLRVDEAGQLHTTRRTATQALSSTADEVGLGFFPFDDDTEYLRSKAWHVAPGERARRSRNELDLKLSQTFLTDARTRVIAVPDVQRGSLVFFEFVAEETPKQLAYQELFVPDVPHDVVRVSVELPDGWTAKHAWLRVDGPEPTQDGNRLVWELRDLSPAKKERMAAGPAQTAPLLQLSILPPPGKQIASATFGDWTELGAWFNGIAAGRDDATTAIRQAADRLELPEDFFGQVEQFAQWVRDNVRYVDKEIGIGSYQPRPAAQVLENLFGDCKDKGTLLQAMLSVRQLTAYPVLIHASLEESVARELPTLYAFNHYIVAIPVPDGEPVPTRYERAVIDGGPLGRLLIVDTTDEYTAIGDVAGQLAGKRALVITPDASHLIEIPDDRAGGHGNERSVAGRIESDGSVVLKIRDRRWGDPAAASRAAWAASEQSYVERVRVSLREDWPDATVGEIEITPYDESGFFRSEFELQLAAPDSGATAPLMSIFPGALSRLPRVSVRRRESPVLYDHPITLKVVSTIEGLSAGTSEPAGSTSEGAGWALASQHELDGTTLRSEWTLELSRREFGPESFDELDSFWRAARKSARPVVSREPR